MRTAPVEIIVSTHPSPSPSRVSPDFEGRMKSGSASVTTLVYHSKKRDFDERQVAPRMKQAARKRTTPGMSELSRGRVIIIQ